MRKKENASNISADAMAKRSNVNIPSGDNCGSFSRGTKCITVLFPGPKLSAEKTEYQ